MERAKDEGINTRLLSSSFAERSRIPSRHTCDGLDISPEIHWTDVPEGTASFALIVDDPDAPGSTFVHWVVFNIGGNRRFIEEGRLPAECIQGTNDFGNSSYSGPCPPRGAPHSYHFKLYALTSNLSLRRGCSKHDVEKAMKTHVVGSAELIGQYGR